MDGYKGGAVVTWVLIFVGTWIYCIAEYGFLLGVGLGWLAAAITASVLCWLLAALPIRGACHWRVGPFLN